MKNITNRRVQEEIKERVKKWGGNIFPVAMDTLCKLKMPQ
jgi:hypothetical protein